MKVRVTGGSAGYAVSGLLSITPQPRSSTRWFTGTRPRLSQPARLACSTSAPQGARPPMRTVPPPGWLPPAPGPPAPGHHTVAPALLPGNHLDPGGNHSSATVGWNRTPCSLRSTSPDGVRRPFMTCDNMEEPMTASRAASFWLIRCASIRSHRARGSTVAGSAASTFAWSAGSCASGPGPPGSGSCG